MLLHCFIFGLFRVTMKLVHDFDFIEKLIHLPIYFIYWLFHVLFIEELISNTFNNKQEQKKHGIYINLILSMW